MNIQENLNPEKADIKTVSFRTPASYKEYLEEMAGEYGYNVSELLNSWVRHHIFERISFKARKYALEKVCPKYGIPESMAKGLETIDDWKALRAFLGDEKYEEFSVEYHGAREDKANEIAGEDGFEWNYDTNTGLIS
jgi:hypothetical protein